MQLAAFGGCTDKLQRETEKVNRQNEWEKRRAGASRRRDCLSVWHFAEHNRRRPAEALNVEEEMGALPCSATPLPGRQVAKTLEKTTRATLVSFWVKVNASKVNLDDGEARFLFGAFQRPDSQDERVREQRASAELLCCHLTKSFNATNVYNKPPALNEKCFLFV